MGAPRSHSTTGTVVNPALSVCLYACLLIRFFVPFAIFHFGTITTVITALSSVGACLSYVGV